MSTGLELTSEELLHLAISDSRNSRHEDAIVKLKRCLKLAPKDSRVHHLLAAEHAEIGMYNEAAAGFERAISLDPSSTTARFQLGLLHAVNHRADEARKAWAPLASLPPSEPLVEFSEALQFALDGNAAAAIQHLDLGLSLPSVNAALQKDMSQLKSRLQAARAAAEKNNGEAAGAMLLESYKGSSGEPEA